MTDLKHMDVGSRNQRLRETLEGMGLFVVPIFSEADPSRIDYMHVSASPPSWVTQKLSEDRTCASVAVPVAGAKVAQVVGSIESKRDNVIDFPSVLGP